MCLLHEYELSILNILKKHGSIDINYLEKELGINRDAIIWAVENLNSNGMADITRDAFKTAKLTGEGKNYLEKFPEEELVESAYKNGGGTLQLKGTINEIGLIWAKRNGWLNIEKGKVVLTAEGIAVATGKTAYKTKELLNSINNSNGGPISNTISKYKEFIEDLKKRNLIEISEKGVIKSINITEKGIKETTGMLSGVSAQGTLTREMIANWRTKKERLRPYDIYTSTEEANPARLHPMHEFIDVVRQAWLNMGFTEVSGPIIESAFWNFDALFSPQDHPTRDMQDTFFLKNPTKISIEDMALMKRVKKMHSSGWKYKWREDVAQQALLRTHTTSVSAHYINKFAENSSTNYPIKLFSIGRIFRNESIDYKHLAEFHQVDGIVIGNNLTLSNLIYILKQFYAQIGLEKITVKPSYFPFVEPGLEVNYYDEEKDTTIELVGSGIIRKEITKAMGTNKTVLAWGAGLERLMFNAMGISSVTDIYKNDIGWLRKRNELRL